MSLMQTAYMRRKKLVALLKQRPGYEVVYLLIQSDRRRKELAEYSDSDGGTLQRWLDKAERKGLVTRDVFLDHNEEKCVEYSLDCDIPPDLVSVILDRGGHGPRDNRDFADTAGVHHWSDPYSLDTNENSSGDD